MWDEEQLSDDLQAIVAKDRLYFDGDKVITCAADIETDIEE